jgi:hypothetical protein
MPSGLERTAVTVAAGVDGLARSQVPWCRPRTSLIDSARASESGGARLGGYRGQERGAEGPGIPGDAVDASGVRAAGDGRSAVEEHGRAGRDSGEILVRPAGRARVGSQSYPHVPPLGPVLGASV